MKNKQITIIDVAQAAGVSIATVSNVLNRRNVPLTEETIRKVEEAASRLGYRRNVMAASLSRRKTFELGLLLPHFGGFYGDFAHAMQRTVHEWGYHLSVYSSSGSQELEQSHLETLLQRRVDGLFCHGLAMSPDLTRTIVGEGTPMVLFNAWGWPDDLAVGAVNMDFANGCVQVVRHLADRGCRTLYYIGKSYSRATDGQRIIGFSRGAEELKAQGAIDHFELLDADTLPKEQIRSVFAAGVEKGMPLGVLAFDDFIAFEHISAFREWGFDVPGQIKVAGINDQPVAWYNSPAITSLTNDHDTQVKLAAELLFREMGETRRGMEKDLLPEKPGHEIHVPMRLIVRKSTE